MIDVNRRITRKILDQWHDSILFWVSIDWLWKRKTEDLRQSETDKFLNTCWSLDFFPFALRIVREQRLVKSSGQNDHYPFGWRVFSAWDFLITERETADNKLASLTTAIRVRLVYLLLIGRWYMIIWVIVVLNRTVFDSDWRFDNLSGSHFRESRCFWI